MQLLLLPLLEYYFTSKSIVLALFAVSAVLSRTVIVCTWFWQRFPQLSTKLPCSCYCETSLATIATGVASTNVVFNPDEQLFASLVTSPVAVTVFYRKHICARW
jgi:hypothetical protein